MIRTSLRAAALAVAALALAAPAHAARPVDSTADDRRAVSVTVYNNNLGLVREVRRIDLPGGEHEVRFMDVAEAIQPETVAVSAVDGRPVRVLEQNYEYDLLSPEKVLEKYVGREVTVYVKHGESDEERPVKAELLSTNGGPIFRIGDEVSLGLPGRVVVPDLPRNLIASPTLVWLLGADREGRRDLEVSYLTGAMKWQADYVATLSTDEKTLDLTGWVTVDNRSGAGYENAKLKLVAGDVHRASPPPRPVMMKRAMAMSAAAPEEAFAERTFFEHHLYELGRPTTLKQNQTKQIELLTASGVPVIKRYLAESRFRPYPNQSTGDTPNKAKVKIELVNAKAGGLGQPLPAGVVRVYKRDTDEALTFAGEDRIDHTPKDERVRLTMGDAFDVVWERKVTSFREISNREVDAEIEIRVRNRKDEDVTVRVVERFHNEREVLRSSIDPTEPDAFTLEFAVPVDAGDETVLKYRVRAKR